jgi:3-deoxy-D-manno-octulosonic-acid transferase
MKAAHLLTRTPLALRIGAFRILESMANWRLRHLGATANPTPAAATAAPSLWLFASTIGELNAIEPLIEPLLAALGHPPLTLVTDRETYDVAYRERHPGAAVEQLKGGWSEVRALVRRRPPLMLVVAEIPCLLHDAPCRFSYATLHAVKQAGAPVVAVNGWLYGYTPPSRLDRIEMQWFASDYVHGFDLLMMQDRGGCEALIKQGADPRRVQAMGNVKFDAMLRARAAPRISPLADALRRQDSRPVLVAGSVTETVDQRAVLQAFQRVLADDPRALLILAPRHPEDQPRMAALKELLAETGLESRMRSQHGHEEALRGPVLILDTMGELRDCYRAATLAFVGTDHNVLEPLAFGCPVFVCEGWDPTYPSYPVYRQLRDAGIVNDVGPVSNLAQAWPAFLALTPVQRQTASLRDEAWLKQASGATARCIEGLRAHALLP